VGVSSYLQTQFETNGCHRALQVLVNLCRSKAKNAEPFSFEPFFPHSIMRLLLGQRMHVAIDFDDQLLRKDHKVCNVGSNRGLTPDSNSF